MVEIEIVERKIREIVACNQRVLWVLRVAPRGETNRENIEMRVRAEQESYNCNPCNLGYVARPRVARCSTRVGHARICRVDHT